MKKLILICILLRTFVFPVYGADKLLVVGDATWGGWSLDRTSVMTCRPDMPDVFCYTGWLEADKEFKFLTEAHWDRTEYRNVSSDPYILGEGQLMMCTGNDKDYKFKVKESANYDIVCNLADMSISVNKSDYQSSHILHNILYLVGDATPGGWTLGQALPLAMDSSDPFRFGAKVYLTPGIFKIATNCYGDYNEQKFYFRDATDAGRITEDGTGDRQWTISKEGYYDVAVNLAAATISITELDESTPLGKALSWAREDNSLVVTAANGELELTPYNDYVVKVFALPAGETMPERRSISVCATPEARFTVEENEESIVLSTSATRAVVSKADCHVEFTDLSGKSVLREKGGIDNSGAMRRISFDGMGDRAFYGGGYNGRTIDHNGSTLVMNNTQTGGWDCTWNAPHNICVPFIVSTSGYGILFDDHYRNARIVPSAQGTSYNSASLNPVAYYYVGSCDGSMASVMENYTFLTGRQELPPYWALGYMTSRYGYHSRTEAEEIVAGIKEAGLPLDGIVFDLYWQGEGNSGMGNLDWYAPKWNNPAEMMKNFAEQGVKTICITEPFFTSVSANYEPLRQLGYLADEDVAGMEWLGAPKTGLIDTSNPDAMDWMWNFYKKRTEEGVGGWWLDLGEPERHDDDSRHAGGTVSQVHNELGDLWTARVYRGFKEEFPDVRPFLMPRAGTSGMQRYSTFPWTGDIRRSYKGLEAQIPAMLSAGMSGIGYMGNDVSGFAADDVGTDKDLYLRWMELAVFSPVLRTHSTFKPEPHLDCYADVFPSVKKYIEMHYSYLPYTYTLAWENATQGSPLMRPINYHDLVGEVASPENCTDEYLYGADILVAPVVTENTFSREITFPQGEWVDLNDLSAVYAGGSSVNYDVPLEKLPHFGRKGAFITRFAQDTYTNTSEIDNTHLAVTYLADFEGGEVRSVLFDDDRRSTTSLSDKQSLLTTFEGENIAGAHIIRIVNEGSYTGMPDRRVYEFTVPVSTFDVGGMELASGDNMTLCNDRAAFDRADEGVYYVAADKTLHFKVGVDTDKNETVTISGERAGLGSAPLAANCVFEYSHRTGLFSIAMPDGTDGATVSVHDVNGILLAEIPVEECDGTVKQLSLPVAHPGFYLATLRGTTPDANQVNLTIKCLSK